MGTTTWPRPALATCFAWLVAQPRVVGAALAALKSRPGRPGRSRRAQAKAERLAAAGVRNAAAGRRPGRLRRAVNDLTELLDAARQIAGHTRLRLAGTTPDGAARRVSLHEPDARPIAKGRLGKPVEFGYYAASRIMPRRGRNPLWQTGFGGPVSA